MDICSEGSEIRDMDCDSPVSGEEKASDSGVKYEAKNLVRDCDDPKKVQCLWCGRELCKKGFVIRRHYKYVHEVQFAEPEAPPIKRPRLSSESSTFHFASKLEYLDCLMRITADTSIPLRFWDNKDVRRLLTPHEKRHKVRASSRIVRNQILLGSKETMKKISGKLKNKLFPLKYDIGSKRGKFFLGINAQVIEGPKVILIGLGLIPLTETQCADYIARVVVECLNTYGLSMKQVTTITSDNGRNMLKASSELLKSCEEAVRMFNDVRQIEDTETDVMMEEEDDHAAAASQYLELEWEDVGEGTEDEKSEDKDDEIILQPSPKYEAARIIRCVAHTIQLGVNDYIRKDKEVVEFLTKMKKSAQKWRDYINKHGIKEAVPSICNDTRWSSTYVMLKSMIRIQHFIDHQDGGQIDWKLAEDLQAALAPVAELTTKMQALQYVFGDYVNDFADCIEKLNEMWINNLHAKELQLALESRQSQQLSSPAVLAALFMDPRYHTNDSGSSLTKEEQALAVEYIVDIRNQLRSAQKVEEVQKSTRAATQLLSCAKTYEFGMGRTIRMEQAIDETPSPSDDIAQFIEKLKSSAGWARRQEMSVDVLAHWHQRKGRSEELYKIAKIVLATPSSQVSVERMFSCLPLIVTEKRTRIGVDLVRAICLLRINKHLI